MKCYKFENATSCHLFTCVMTNKNTPCWVNNKRLLHQHDQGNEGDCLHAPWCPWNATVEIYNILIRCPLPGRKCFGALALAQTKHSTGLEQNTVVFFCQVLKIFPAILVTVSGFEHSWVWVQALIVKIDLGQAQVRSHNYVQFECRSQVLQ